MQRRDEHLRRPATGRRRNRRLRFIVFATVLLLAAIVYSGYQRDLEEAWARVAAGSRIAETPCGPIEYAEAGEGPSVLIVHGAGGGFDQGLEFGRPLAAEGFRVIAVSRFGYLRTPLPADASPAAQADAHACLLDALGIERAAIVGASAGAPSSTQFALRHPQRTTSLVLLVPAGYAPRSGGADSMETPAGTQLLFDTALRSDFLFWVAIRSLRPTVIRAILATPPEVVANASPEEQARVRQVLEHILPVSARRAGLLNDARILSRIERYELERIAAPTLIISLEDDLFGTFEVARYTAEQIRGARFIPYASGGHVWVGHHKDVIAAIADFATK